jgi:hypothetical protein
MLAKIDEKVPIDFDMEKCRWGSYDREKITRLFKKLDFNSLIARLP